jgi:hypothetical protein
MEAIITKFMVFMGGEEIESEHPVNSKARRMKKVIS